MITSKVTISAAALALCLLLTASAQAGRPDHIRLAHNGELSPNGFAGVTTSYSCAPRAAGATHLQQSVGQTFGPNGEYWVSSSESYRGPLECDGRTHKVTFFISADYGHPAEGPRFVLGPVRVFASFWNDTEGFFGPTDQATVVLR